jgi:hypothetical protein
MLSRPMPTSRPVRGDPPGACLLPVVFLGATLGAAFLVLRGPDRLFGWALGAMLGASLLWIVISVLFPAKADRTCPRCGAESLERSDPQRTEGLACTSCGWRDDAESGFLLAEDDGVPIEPMVLRRRAERARAADAGAADVDTDRTDN